MTRPETRGSAPEIEMPSPTSWPIVLAFGLTLLAAGLVTHVLVAWVGMVCACVGAVGWGRVAHSPQGRVRESWVPVEERPAPIEVATSPVQSHRPTVFGHRTLLPHSVHPYRSGARGGVIGGIVMAIVATVYGVVSGHGVWYPVNLLSGIVLVPDVTSVSYASLESFQPLALALGVLIHAAVATSVGVLYALLLPMLPGRPLIWGGLVAPLLWMGLIHSAITVLNPVLERYVSWLWFVVSQCAYGVVVGYVVQRSQKVSARAVGSGSGLAGRSSGPDSRMPVETGARSVRAASDAQGTAGEGGDAL